MQLIALTLSLLFSFWVIVHDCMRRRSLSWAVWVPTVLLLILGSRPVSLWLSGGHVRTGELGNNVEGNASDLIFFAVILAVSFLIATSRRISWPRVLVMNPALMMIYFYFVTSVCWSGDPMGSFKRIIKDFSLLFVIAVIYLEKDPQEAMRAIYVRCAALLIPLSVVFVKWFPSYSRSYTVAGGIMDTGVTTQKNSLGEIVLVFSLFLIWDYLEMRREFPRMRFRQFPWEHLLLLLMGVWLLRISQSKSGLVCIVLGALLISRPRWMASKLLNRAVLAGALAAPLLLFFSQEFESVIAPFVKSLGRDMTFTGRANIWAHITSTTVNPLIGAGFWNFWGGPDGYAIALAMQTDIPNAHCGYVDLYLDGGILALCLLFILLLTSGNRIINYLRRDRDESRYLRVRMAFLIVAMIYNLAESSFFRMSLLWFTTLLMIVDFPVRSLTRRTPKTTDKASSSRVGTSPVYASQRPETVAASHGRRLS